MVTLRYEQRRSILLTTNKAFANGIRCSPPPLAVVTLVDRLLHCAEIITL